MPADREAYAKKNRQNIQLVHRGSDAEYLPIGGMLLRIAIAEPITQEAADGG